MKLTVSPLDGEVFVLDVPGDTSLAALKMMISLESGKAENLFILMKDGQVLQHTNKNLMDAGFQDDDLVVLVPAAPPTGSQHTPTNTRINPNLGSGRLDFSSIRLPGTSTSEESQSLAEKIRQTLLKGPPHLITLFRQKNPELISVINDPAAFSRIFEAQRSHELQGYQELQQMNMDPLNPAIQTRIEEMIRQQNIDMHMETALEHYPETFGQVSMLFVNCKIGSHAIKAFVDSGAQSTIMSERCARRCNLEAWIDKRWAGKAYGVGTQTIIGRVHNGQIEIGGIFLPTSFIVLKDQQLDLMLGLDMLKRHQCCIDLKRNVLSLDAGRVETPFLPESEIPAQFRHAEMTDGDALDSSSVECLTAEQRGKIEQLVSQGVPETRAIRELEAHGWDVQAALVAYMSSDDVP